MNGPQISQALDDCSTLSIFHEEWDVRDIPAAGIEGSRQDVISSAEVTELREVGLAVLILYISNVHEHLFNPRLSS